MKREIILCGRTYLYEPEKKKVKNLNLHITSDGIIYISAPESVPIYSIEKFLKANEVKIAELMERYERISDANPMPRNYTDGEELLYLGNVLKLRVLKAGKNYAELKENHLYINVKEPENTGAKRKILESFFKEESRRILTKICGDYYDKFCPPLTAFPEIRFRKMRSRWGSCTPKKNLLCFNSCLACVPYECIEYVAAHEFTHFIHPDHSRNFYSELGNFMPDHREREKILKGYSQVPLKFCK